MKDLIEKILCIECKGNLLAQGKLVKCKKCNKAYLFKNGILMMLHDISLKDIQNASQKKYWDDQYETVGANKETEWRRRWITRLLGFLPKNRISTVLDLACGQAYMTLPIAKAGHKVVACDISIGGLLKARRAAEKAGVEKNILFIECDINKIYFKKNTFDFIVLLHVLEHFKHDKMIIKKLISCAKANAVYYIGVPLSLKYVFTPLIPFYMLSDNRVGHLRRYSLEDILKLFPFKAESIHTVYTGHLIKFVGLFLSTIGIDKWEKRIEDLDERGLETKLWASNITAVIRGKKAS